MVQITKESGMQSAAIPFAWVEVQYPDKAQWDEDGFYDMVCLLYTSPSPRDS